MHLSKYKRLLLFMTIVLWSSAFAKSILPPYYLSQGISYLSMIVGMLILFGTQLIFLLSVRKGRARILWKISFFSSLFSLLLVIKILNVWQFYLAYLMSGISLSSYWVAYNIAYFANTPKEKTGLGSAIMFSVVPLLSVIAPPLAGYVLQVHPVLFWTLSVLFYFIFYIFIDKQEDFAIHYTIRSSIEEIRATRMFVFIEGVWEAMILVIIPVYSLFFIKTPLAYGTFTAYLALVGIIANLSLGKLTDKLQKRVLFLYPLTIIMAIVTYIFPMGLSNLTYWLLVTGILNFFVPIFWNLSTAMFIDTHENLSRALPGREIILAAGRTVGILLTLVSVIVEPQPVIIFYVLGSVILGFPFYLFWISKYKKKYVFR